MLTIKDILLCGPVVPVIVIEDVRDAVPLARALLAGGVRVLEVTLRTPAGLAAIEAIAREVEGVVLGAGTLTVANDIDRAMKAGAVFGVSPGLTPELAAAARATGLPLLPGAMTPSEVLAAMAHGYTELKLFPARAAGGVDMLKSLAGPFPTVSFCPTGGITAASAADYLALSNVRCVGGSWLTPPDAVRARDWKRITQLATDASALRVR